jgi:hypothetical protein
MKKFIAFTGLTLVILLNLVSCGVDQDNFDLADHIVGNDELIKELENWDVDSAYIQFIGFAPNEDFEYYKDLSMSLKMSGVYPEEFFEQFDIQQPIIKVWALRKNTFSGNKFDESGIGSNDMVDYQNGVGRRDARNLHDLGDYSETTYEWSSFYLASYNGKLKMLSSGYPEDRSCIDFFEDVIKLNGSQSKEAERASKQVGMYIKGKGIVMVEPTKLNAIITKSLKKSEEIEESDVSDESDEIGVDEVLTTDSSDVSALETESVDPLAAAIEAADEMKKEIVD